jgi:N-acetylglucosamine repressor
LKGNNNSIIKEANKQLILNTISNFGPITNEDIIFRTRLSRPTVVNILKDLTEEAIVDKVGFSKSTGGRSAQLFEMGTSKYFSIGVDLEFPTVRIVATNLKAEIVYSRIWTFKPPDSKDEVLSRLIKEINLAIKSICKQEEKIIGIGLGLPGLLDVRRGVSLDIERIVDWKNIDIQNLLEKEFNLPVYIRNDVHLLALINKKKYLDKKTKNYIYISLRSGVGMAVFINGELFEGELGNAGYIGHMVLDVKGNVCQCKNRGCVETFVGEWAILKNYLEKKPDLNPDEVTFETLIADFAAGYPDAVEVIWKASYYLGVAISNVFKLIDIPFFVINGLPKQHCPKMMDWLKQGVQDNILAEVSKDIILTAEYLEEGEKALGGALLVNEDFFAEPKLNLAPNPALSMVLDGEKKVN